MQFCMAGRFDDPVSAGQHGRVPVNQKGQGMLYTTERYEAYITVEEYLKEYVDVEQFLECCKACPNYNNIWACPPYDFDVLEYWNRYRVLQLIAVKINFGEKYAGKAFTQEQLDEIERSSVWQVKAELTSELYKLEQENPGSISLSAGSCMICNRRCARADGKPCRFPDKVRYSIESLGGNVGTTISNLMEIELEWVQEGRLPSHYVLVCGLLRP